MRKYTIVLEYDPDTQSYAVTVPALLGCATLGNTVDEAITNAREAIELYIESLTARGLEIPEEAEVQAITISVAA